VSHLVAAAAATAFAARSARAEIERALDTAGWPWRRRLSLWIDALLVLEEAG